MQNIKK